jgi:hypothetical protein
MKRAASLPKLRNIPQISTPGNKNQKRPDEAARLIQQKEKPAQVSAMNLTDIATTDNGHVLRLFFQFEEPIAVDTKIDA